MVIGWKAFVSYESAVLSVDNCSPFMVILLAHLEENIKNLATIEDSGSRKCKDCLRLTFLTQVTEVAD